MNMVADFTNLDRFFFYFFLPAIIIVLLGGHRYYFKKKKPASKVFKISQDLIFGNFISVYLALATAIFLYFYILNIDILKDLKWELLTLIGMIFLSFPIGVGMGAHLVAVSLEKLRPPETVRKKEIIKALRFFHYPFSHNLSYSPMLLLAYLLTLLDLFKGRELEMTIMQTSLTILAGLGLGSAFGLLLIITKSHKLILPPMMVLLLSLLLATIGEARSISRHPVSLLFTTGLITSSFGIFIYKQTKFNLRPPVKRFVKHWFQWDIDIL